jgi:hypothetical protein
MTNMQSVERVASMLRACGTAHGVLPPTALYNEGWMLRLVLDAFEGLTHPTLPLKAAPGGRWLSEVLLPSRFLARSRSDKLAEGWTHADAVVGHFTLKAGGRGDIQLARDATQLVVVEAKMFSPLSAGTSKAKTFNQAARNVACMAHVISEAAVSLTHLEALAFVVLAPESQLSGPDFRAILSRESISAAVEARVGAYKGVHDEWLVSSCRPLCERIQIVPIPWERAIAEIAVENRTYAADLTEFYARCVEHNQPMTGGLRSGSGQIP